jgi:flagellar biosynthetic protein FliP
LTATSAGPALGRGDRPVRTPRGARRARALAGALVLAGACVLLGAGPSSAAPVGPVAVASEVTTATTVATAVEPAPPVEPTPPTAPSSDPTVTLDINGVNGTPDSSIVVLLAITLLSVAPSLLLMMTSFTKIFVVLALTRNALGLTGVPPNQVLAGISLFISLFIMGPVLGEVNEVGVQPYLDGDLTFSAAVDAGSDPLREFMLGQTREDDLALVTRAADQPNPETREDVGILTLIPAFMLSELRSAFIIGFVVFVPFLVIDLVVSSSLMSMGMMMLPPVMVSLPFKLLLFVLVDGWGLIVTALVGSYG